MVNVILYSGSLESWMLGCLGDQMEYLRMQEGKREYSRKGLPCARMCRNGMV